MPPLPLRVAHAQHGSTTSARAQRLSSATRTLRRRGRRRFPSLAVTLALLTQIACTNAAVDKAVGSTDGPSTVVVTRGEAGITVQNLAGRPLLNIRVAIEPSDGGQAFVHTLPTLDTGLSREVPFADFRTEEGTLFEPGAVAPKEIQAAARDTLGNNYTVKTPWDRQPPQQ